MNRPRYRRGSLAALLLAAALAGCAESPVAPATSPLFTFNGSFDGNGHPYVGAMLYDWLGDGIDGYDEVCTGTLIAPTVFLTAGHCVAGFPPGTQFWVSFDAELLDDPTNLAMLVPVSSAAIHPGYKPALGGDIRDLAVLLLPAGSTAGITPALLPSAGLLDQLAAHHGLRKTEFVQVGYGVAATAKGHPAFSYDGRRNTGLAPFSSLTAFQLKLNTNTTATGLSGSCYGDSGSPKLLPGTNTVTAVTSWGDVPCRASEWTYRLDTGSARSFLAGYLTLP